ncbi:MAG: zinc ribbon domain-containing protein [Clostridia bacterium]|nr:zinc ribbon domain-containing protein [Clostridia bacterium]
MSNNSNKQDNIWQLAGVVVLGIIALVLVYNEFFTTGSGYGINSFYGSGGGLSLTALITGILVLAVKVLKILLVVGLVVGSVLAAKKYLIDNKKLDFSFGSKDDDGTYQCPSCATKLDAEFKFCPDCKTPLNKKCACGKELQIGWKCCPHCGTAQEQSAE